MLTTHNNNVEINTSIDHNEFLSIDQTRQYIAKHEQHTTDQNNNNKKNQCTTKRK